MSDPIRRLNEALEGRYRIVREIGEGGMATVYLADDLRHERNVAIKVLKPELAAVVGADRFLAEIKTTANLQHPHILPLHDSGEADGFLFYVMPFVEGETLRERLDREKQLPVEEAVAIAAKIAGALQAAHDQGIIHRDIKPANILLAKGEPLVADFGIALAVQEAGGGRLTETGLSVGTPYYMSPEQATADRDPDARSDIYSLACLLYEVLAGDPPFTGRTAQAVLGQILTQTAPSVATARPTVPPNVDAAILQGLQKLPADRFESAADFAKALADEGYRGPAARASGAAVPAVAPPDGPGRWIPWAVAAAATLVAIGALTLGPGGSDGDSTEPRPLRFTLEDRIDRFGTARSLAVSADGSVIVYKDLVDGRPVLIRRDLSRIGGEPLPASEGALYAAISPNGRWVAYDSGEDSVLYRIQPGATRPTVMAHPRNPPMGISWLSDTELLGGMFWFDGDYPGVRSVSLEDSTLTERSNPRADDATGMHHEPYGLPDGRHALIIDLVRGDEDAISVLDLEDGTWERLDLGGAVPLSWTGITGVADSVFVFREQGGRLMAVRWDPDRLRTVGVAVPIPGIDGAVRDAVLSHDGTLVMAFEPRGHRPVIVDERGNIVRALPIEDIGRHFYPRVGPNPDLIYVESGILGNHRDWLVDLRLGTVRDFAIGDRRNLGGDRIGDWLSPDRFVVARQIQQSGPDPALLVARSARPEAVGEFAVLPDTLPPADHVTFSRDGAWAALTSDREAGTGRQVWILSLETGESRSFVGLGAGSTYAPAISPDGTRLAFVTEIAGRPEVFMTSFPEEGEVTRISEGRSGQPVWGPSGERIYYVTQTGLVGADLATDDQDRPYVADRRVLFDLPMFGEPGSEAATYDVHPDGFVLALEEGDDGGRIIVWKDWIHELEPLLGGS